MQHVRTLARSIDRDALLIAVQQPDENSLDFLHCLLSHLRFPITSKSLARFCDEMMMLLFVLETLVRIRHFVRVQRVLISIHVDSGQRAGEVENIPLPLRRRFRSMINDAAG